MTGPNGILVPGATAHATAAPAVTAAASSQPDQVGDPRYSRSSALLVVREWDPLTNEGDENNGAIADALVAQMGPEDETPGQLTFDEFREATGFDDMTEEAWNAMIGFDQGNTQLGTGAAEGEFVVKDLRHLASYLQQFRFYTEITGVNFDRFARWENITIVPREQLLQYMMSLSEQGIRDLVHGINYQHALQALRRLGIVNIDDLPGTDQGRLEDAMVEAVIRLQDAAAGSGPAALRARHVLSMIGLLTLGRLNEQVEDEHGKPGLAAERYGLRDPLAARHFLNTVFTSYIAGETISDEQLEALEGFSDSVGLLREAAGDNVELNQKIDNADYESEEFQQVLGMIDGSATHEDGSDYTEVEIQAAIRDLPQVLTHTPGSTTHSAASGTLVPHLPGAVPGQPELTVEDIEITPAPVSQDESPEEAAAEGSGEVAEESEEVTEEPEAAAAEPEADEPVTDETSGTDGIEPAAIPVMPEEQHAVGYQPMAIVV
ncbi:MAG: hypothetical protein JW782_02940 [Candidatus Saganbacteria bacterium]|nr:hypothetical protein [Candidatus Saganbacteria bacterium]